MGGALVVGGGLAVVLHGGVGGAWGLTIGHVDPIILPLLHHRVLGWVGKGVRENERRKG